MTPYPGVEKSLTGVAENLSRNAVDIAEKILDSPKDPLVKFNFCLCQWLGSFQGDGPWR